MPPASGIAAPSSASERAPRSVSTPPMTQTPSIQPGVRTERATSEGTRKMPEPMIVPMTRLIVSNRLSSRASSAPWWREPPSSLTRTPSRPLGGVLSDSGLAVRQASLELLQLLLEVVQALLEIGGRLGRRRHLPVPAPVAPEVPLEVAGPVLPRAPVPELADPHLARLALGDRDGDALRRPVAEQLDRDRLAALLVPQQPDELARGLDAVAVDLRDDVADLEAGLRGRSVRLDRADHDAGVLRRSEVLAQLGGHLDRPHADEPASAVLVHAHDEGVAVDLRKAFELLEAGEHLRIVVARDEHGVAVDDDLPLRGLDDDAPGAPSRRGRR